MSLRHSNNTSNSTVTLQCNVNALLERQSSRTTSTRQCNINTPLGLQDISTTPHLTLKTKCKSINVAPNRQFRFTVSRRT